MNALAVGLLVSSLAQGAGEETLARKLQRALHLIETRGEPAAAIPLLEEASGAEDPSVAVRALLELGRCYEPTDPERAAGLYRRLVDVYPGRPESAEAERRLRSLSRELEPPETLTARRIQDDLPIDVFWTTLAPGGTAIATLDLERGGVVLRDLRNGRVERLAEDRPEGTPRRALVSPDGSLVALEWLVGSDEGVELTVLGRSGERLRAVEATDVLGARPEAWSPDGTRVLWTLERRGRSSELVWSSLHEDGLDAVLEFDATPHNVSLSPDGTRAVFDLPPGSRAERDLYLVPSTGGTPHRLTSHPADDVFPIWTPDGGGVVFVSRRSGAYGLWFLAISGGTAAARPRALYPDLGLALPFGFGSDGAFYFARVESGLEILVLDLSSGDDAPLRPPVALDIGVTGWSFSPSWSPDGRCLALVSERRETFLRAPAPSEILVGCREDGTWRRERVLDGVEGAREVVWSPDGASLLATGRGSSGRSALIRLDVETGELLATILDGGRLQRLRFRDRDQLLYRRQVADGWRWNVIALSSLEETPLALEEEGWYPPAEIALSPDSRLVAYAARERARARWRIFARDLATGESHVLHEVEGGGLSLSPIALAWHPRIPEIWFVTRGPTEREELYRLHVETGAVSSTGITLPRFATLGFSPRGDAVAILSGATQWKRDLWRLENLPYPKAPEP